MTKFLNHTRIKTVVGENGNYGKWEILGRITYYRMKRFEIKDIRSVSVVQLRELMEIFEVCCGMSRQRLFCKDDNGTNWKISSSKVSDSFF